MTSTLLATLLVALCTCSLSLLCLSMRRHARTVDSRLLGHGSGLRLAGWSALAASTALAIAARGWGMGPVYLLACMTPAGLIVSSFATYRPRGIVGAAIVGFTIALILSIVFLAM